MVAKPEAVRSSLEDILPFRSLFLRENNFQIRYDACHRRGWSDSWLLILDGEKVGYGSVKGKEELEDRDAVFEFFIIPSYRKYANSLFEVLLEYSGVKYIECQSNDHILSSLFFEFGHHIFSEVVLFEDHVVTDRQMPGVLFRSRRPGDDVFGKKAGDSGAYVLEKDGEIVADGGFLTHYNEPFADLYMETRLENRNQGLATFILQEVKKECYKAGRAPAARCNISNKASKRALIKAGMRVCGYMLCGEVRPSFSQ